LFAATPYSAKPAITLSEPPPPKVSTFFAMEPSAEESLRRAMRESSSSSRSDAPTTPAVTATLFHSRAGALATAITSCWTSFEEAQAVRAQRSSGKSRRIGGV
jgi:hypothetical protein